MAFGYISGVLSVENSAVIEAGCTGESGKGFAVVKDVHELAERCTNAAEDIKALPLDEENHSGVRLLTATAMRSAE